MRKREKAFLLRLSEKEMKILDEKVSKANIPREEFLRMLISNATIKEAPPVDYYKMIMQLRRIGSNINQVLKLANAKGIIIATDLRKALEDYHKTEKMLWEAFALE